MINENEFIRSLAICQNPNFLCQPEILKQMFVMKVCYISFDGLIHQGQLVVHRTLVIEAWAIFDEILRANFPIARMVPISHYYFDDERSMRANNTSGFNYRLIEGTDRLSQHALGRAIDINPLLNPYIKGERVAPMGAVYDLNRPGTIGPDSVVVHAFLRRGWRWGGNWSDPVDYQHFEKP